MREIAIFYDDGRPDCRVALDMMATGDPFAWDGAVREKVVAAAEGYPAPQAVRLASRQLVRTDVMGEGEGLRLDICWFDGSLTSNTERVESHVEGVGVHKAYEQAGRTLVLVNPEDVCHVTQVEADGRVVLQRRFGFLCNVERLEAAFSRYGGGATARFPAGLACDRLPTWDGGGRSAGVSSVCAVHELIRREHPEWYDEERSGLCRRPVWDEGRICSEHGYSEGAWWRTAARAAADGEFYSVAGRAVADALVWRPAVAWWKSGFSECAGLSIDEESGGASVNASGVMEAARWLGLPDRDAFGNTAAALVKDAWNGGEPIADGDGMLAEALEVYGLSSALNCSVRPIESTGDATKPAYELVRRFPPSVLGTPPETYQ